MEKGGHFSKRRDRVLPPETSSRLGPGIYVASKSHNGIIYYILLLLLCDELQHMSFIRADILQGPHARLLASSSFHPTAARPVESGLKLRGKWAAPMAARSRPAAIPIESILGTGTEKRQRRCIFSVAFTRLSIQRRKWRPRHPISPPPRNASMKAEQVNNVVSTSPRHLGNRFVSRMNLQVQCTILYR